MKAYIIWETIENRPVIHRSDFGNLLVYLTKEQAQAYTKELSHFISDTAIQKSLYEIREVELKFIN